MKKVNLQFNLPVTILKEKKRYVAYTPALDLSTSGTSYDQVKERFGEIVHIFFEELIKNNTLEKVLGDMGWVKMQKQWHSPVIISQETETLRVAV